MKLNIKYFLMGGLVPLVFLLSCSSSKTVTQKAELHLLKDADGWVIDTISDGCIWYKYENYYAPFQSKQVVNVLEINLENRDNEFKIVHSEQKDSLSSFAEKHHAFLGVNGGYFESDVSFVKVDGTIHREITLPKENIRAWKNQGAITYDPQKRILDFIYGDNAKYKNSNALNILSSAPMLIYDGKPVGADFVDTEEDLKTFEFEDYRRHQGERHPRTAIALCNNNKMLLFTVDGRLDIAAGMSAKEVTLFLEHFFAPRYALNLDGGGSTSMWISERGDGWGIINHPSDNRKPNRYGQRMINNVLLITKTK